jgi:hypothetical protein
MQHARRWAAVVVLAVAAVAIACGSSSLKRTGESCNASSECDTGLICDFGVHQCAATSSIDAAVPQDDDAAVGNDAPLVPPDARVIDAPPDAPIEVDAPDAI